MNKDTTQKYNDQLITQSFQAQLSTLKQWIASSFTLDAHLVKPVKELYDRYLLDIRHQTGTLGVKPKTFSKELRMYFAKDVSLQKVRFYYKDKPLIEGVDLIND